MGDSSTNIINGSFAFDSIKINGEISKKYSLNIYPNVITRNLYFPDFLIKNELISTQYYYHFPLKMSECLYGQVINHLIQTNLTYCISCSPVNYSINKYGSCLVCPLGATCLSGILDVLPGYWLLKISG